MSRLLKPVLILSLPALCFGCVGEFEYTDTPVQEGGADAGTVGEDDGQQPRALFSSTVQPTVSRCAGSTCHTGTGSPLKFMGSDSADDDYTSITSFPSVVGGFDSGLANLLLKIDPGDHYGMAYSDGERSNIVLWLASEQDARSEQPPGEDPPPPVTAGALEQWSGCMTKANWDAANMGSWASKDTNNGDECQTCHNDGAFRFNTNNSNDSMFSMNRYELYIIGFFTVRVNPDGSEEVIPAYDKLTRMGDGSTLHPRFGTGDGDNRFQRLEDFYQLTLQTKAAGQCGPATFPTP